MYKSQTELQVAQVSQVKTTASNMPSATLQQPPSIPKWERPKHTTKKLDWAEIKVIDLSTYHEPNGKQKLAEELRDAVSWQLNFATSLPSDKPGGASHGLLQRYWHWLNAGRGRTSI